MLGFACSCSRSLMLSTCEEATDSVPSTRWRSMASSTALAARLRTWISTSHPADRRASQHGDRE
jgi:hypothetical protein